MLGTATAILVIQLYWRGVWNHDQSIFWAQVLITGAQLIGAGIMGIGVLRFVRKADAYWRSVDGSERETDAL